MTVIPVETTDKPADIFVQLVTPKAQPIYVFACDVMAIEPGGGNTCRVVLSRGQSIHAVTVAGPADKVREVVVRAFRDSVDHWLYALLASNERAAMEQRVIQRVSVGVEQTVGQVARRTIQETIQDAVALEVSRLAASNETDDPAATAEAELESPSPVKRKRRQ